MPATVLFVDDDRRTIRSYAEAIEGAGLIARCFHGPDEVLDYLERGGAADVVVWDMMMLPGRAFAGVNSDGGTSTGRLLQRRMRALRPAAAFVLLTNQPFDPDVYERPRQRSFGRSKEETSAQDLAELIQNLLM